MTVYLINIALIFVWAGVLLYQKPSQNKKKLYCTIISLQWILISGLRDWSIGADTLAYKDWFDKAKLMSWEKAFKNLFGYVFEDIHVKDPGYNILQKVFQLFSDNYQIFLIFIAILFTGLMGRWIYKHSSMPEISFLLYSILFYSFYAITGHRQTIATALVVFLGYDLIVERKYIRYFLLAVVAFFIHKSSIVFALFVFISHMKLRKIYVISMSAAIMTVAILGKQLYGPIALWLGFSQDMVDYTGGGAETYATILLLSCIATFILYSYVKRRRSDTVQLYNITFLTTATSVLVYHNQGFMRIQQYFSLFIMITIPELILSMDKRFRPLAYVGVVGLLVVYVIMQKPEYRFFFM